MTVFALLMIGKDVFCANASFEKTGGSEHSVVGLLANETGLAYNRTYDLTPGIYNMKKVSAVVEYTSHTFTAVTFTSRSYTLNGDDITIASHGLTDGLKVTYSKGSGTDPGGLSNGGTYYVGRVDANTISLASSLANALAGTFIVLTSSTSGDTETYTLTPAGISGTPSFKWQGKNDRGQAIDLDIQSISITEYTYGGAKVGFDFDDFNYTTLLLNVTAPTAGGLELKATMNLKE